MLAATAGLYNEFILSRRFGFSLKSVGLPTCELKTSSSVMLHYLNLLLDWYVLSWRIVCGAWMLTPSSPPPSLPIFEISVVTKVSPTGAPITSKSSVNVLKSSYWAITALAIIPILCLAFACYAGYRCRKAPKRYMLDRSDDPDSTDYMYPPI